MPGLHLVLVTLHGWFKSSIEQDKHIDDTKYIIFSTTLRSSLQSESNFFPQELFPTMALMIFF